MPKRKLAILSLLLTAAIWGIAGPVIKSTLSYVSPFTFLFFRFLVASLVVFPFFIKEYQKHPLHRDDLPQLTILSIFGQTLTLSLIFLGFERTTALEGVLLASTVPVFIIIAGAIFLKEIVNQLEKIGLLIIIFGSLITTIDPLLNLNDGNKISFIGNLLILLSGISWTVFSIKSKELFEKYTPFTITAYSFFIGLATFTPLALWEQFVFPSSTFQLLPAAPGILYMAVFSSVIAYYTYEVGLKYIEASEAAIFSYLQPVFAVPISVLFLHEKVTPPLLLGAMFLALGVIISNRGAALQRQGSKLKVKS